jgi:hypothetical protein
MVNEVKSSVDICHNLEYILDRIEEYKDKLDKEDIINIWDFLEILLNFLIL